jgi:hypothetical protein
MKNFSKTKKAAGVITKALGNGIRKAALPGAMAAALVACESGPAPAQVQTQIINGIVVDIYAGNYANSSGVYYAVKDNATGEIKNIYIADGFKDQYTDKIQVGSAIVFYWDANAVRNGVAGYASIVSVNGQQFR